MNYESVCERLLVARHTDIFLVMWFEGKPVLDLRGHLGKERKKDDFEELPIN